jgi:glycosyltransferase involved in cell wall biosynthesis
VKVSIVANGFQEDYTLNLINALARQDLQVDFIGSNIYDSKLIDDKINFLNVRKEDRAGAHPLKKAFWVLQYFLWYLVYLIREKNNIIHIQWLRFYVVDGIVFPLLARMLGHRVVYTAHDVLPHSRDNKRIRFVFKLIYRVQNSLIAHTGYIKSRIQTEFGIKPEKISVIKHGVYVLSEKERMDFSSSKLGLSLPKDEFVLLFFGIITEYKGLDLLAESMKNLQNESARKVRLIVAGRVQSGYEDEMVHLQAEKLGDGVSYLLRHISNEEVNLLFGAADATVLPYREASQSGVMFMSYAHGVPVIAPDLGGFPDDVKEGRTGLLFEPNNADSLQQVIEKAVSCFGVNNASLREEIIQLTSEAYHWDESAAAIVLIYKK